MTCIKFFIGFSGHATTIADLFSRLHYLNTARRHFQISLEDKQYTMERRSGRSKGYRQFEEPHRGMGSAAKTMSVSELQSHISTITLQMKVTTTSDWFTHLVCSLYPPPYTHNSPPPLSTFPTSSFHTHDSPLPLCTFPTLSFLPHSQLTSSPLHLLHLFHFTLPIYFHTHNSPPPLSTSSTFPTLPFLYTSTLTTHLLPPPPFLLSHFPHASPLTTHTGDTVPLPLCRGNRYNT